MNNPTMLYKHPGIHEMHGDNFDYTITEGSEVESALTQGWYMTTTEAKENSGNKPKKAKKNDDPVPAGLEQQ